MTTRAPSRACWSASCSDLLLPLSLATLLLQGSATSQSLALEAAPYPGLEASTRCNSIAATADGRLWFAFQDRLQCLDGDKVHDVPFAPDPQGLGPSTLRSIDSAPDGVLWIGGNRGLWRLGHDGGTAMPVAGLAGVSVWRVTWAPDGGAVVLGQNRLVRIWPDLHCTDLSPATDTSILGIASTSTGLWTWSRTALHRCRWPANVENWQLMADGGPEPILTACDQGDSLLLIQPSRVLRFTADESPQVVAEDLELGNIRMAAAGPDSLWLAGIGELRELPWQGTRSQHVRLYRSGSVIQQSTTALHCDPDGLVWVGWQQGVTRSKRPPSIDNWVFAELGSDDTVSALAEDEAGSTWLGTARGALLRGPYDWQRHDTPWATAKNSAATIVSILSEAGGPLVVATHNSGVWLSTAGQWDQLNLGEDPGMCRSAVIFAGTLWIATDRKVLVFDDYNQPGKQVHLPVDSEGVPAGPSMLVANAGSVPWLASYRLGLLRFDGKSGSFQRHGQKWANDAILAAVDSTQSGLWAASADGLWHLDRITGDRTLRHSMARGAGFHALMTDRAGSLWLSTATQLAHLNPDRSHLQFLSARNGAHPLGYGWRNALLRTNGEVWLGARQGYSSIHPNAREDLLAPLPIRSVTLMADGTAQPIARLNGAWQLPPNTRSCQINLRLGDHAEDKANPRQLRLLTQDGNELARTTGSSLSIPQPGRYALSALTLGQGSAPQELHLGWVIAPAVADNWWRFAIVGAVVALSSAFAWWFGRHSRRKRERRARIGQLLKAAEQPPEQVLDIAFLAVAAGEECAEIARARHASVWLHDTEHGRRVPLAEFGILCNDAEARLRQCCSEGEAYADFGWMINRPEGIDLTLCFRGSGPLEFELFLAAVANPTTGTRDQLQQSLAPLQAGLRKQAWIQRLESNFVHQSAHLHASLHDLRGSLTSLRMSAYMLKDNQRQGSELATEATTVAAAAEQVSSRLDGLMRDLEQTRGVDLHPDNPIPMVQAVVQAMLPRAAAKRIVLELLLPPSSPPVALDTHWLPRVVDNLISNAIKYSVQGGTVRVTGEVENGGFQLNVEDSGPGFATNELDSIFLPGVIGTAKPTAGEEQQGLGLWIARHATRAMGGRLWVANTTPRGARLSLWLPLYEPGCN